MLVLDSTAGQTTDTPESLLPRPLEQTLYTRLLLLLLLPPLLLHWLAAAAAAFSSALASQMLVLNSTAGQTTDTTESLLPRPSEHTLYTRLLLLLRAVCPYKAQLTVCSYIESWALVCVQCVPYTMLSTMDARDGRAKCSAELGGLASCVCRATRVVGKSGARLFQNT